jgi:hypothetical protein
MCSPPSTFFAGSVRGNSEKVIGSLFTQQVPGWPSNRVPGKLACGIDTG